LSRVWTGVLFGSSGRAHTEFYAGDYESQMPGSNQLTGASPGTEAYFSNSPEHGSVRLAEAVAAEKLPVLMQLEAKWATELLI
jgi:hypothetical protein